MLDTFTLYQVIQVPYRTETYEVILDLPEQHVAISLDKEKCAFLDDNHFYHYFTKLNTIPDTFYCVDYHQLQVHNDCCLKVAQMDLQGILTECTTVIYDEDPKLIRFIYESFTSMFIHSFMAIREEKLITVCEGDEEIRISH